MKDFSEIYTEYYPKLLRFACDFVSSREDAENLLHDTFIDLWKINEHISEINNINAYMFRLVRNRCIDYLKHRVYERNYEAEAVVEHRSRMEVLESMGDEELIAGELGEIIRRAVDGLPPRCREIFLLSRIENLTYAEIAEHLGLSENTVGVQISIALRRLRAVTDSYMA